MKKKRAALTAALGALMAVMLTACLTVTQTVPVPSSSVPGGTQTTAARPPAAETSAVTEPTADGTTGTAPSATTGAPQTPTQTPPSQPTQEPAPTTPATTARGDKAGTEFDGEWENAYGPAYYVDSQNGDDSRSGTSPQTAWKTLSKVNRTEFEPGTRILLKAGSIWNEALVPRSSGTADGLIVIDKYGEGPKPIINGDGDGAGILLSNLEYIEVRNLEVTNTSDMESSRRGVYVTAGGQTAPGVYDEGGYSRHIYLINLDVHDVTATAGERWAGGIVFLSLVSENPTAFEDVLVEGCTVKGTAANGISFVSNYNNRVGVSWGAEDYFPSKNVVFRNNYIADVGGDGLYVNCVDGPLMEYNTVTNTSWAGDIAYAGMWPHNSTGAVMQYNEAYGVRKVGGDGQGFDVDINCERTVVQYNYSHDNEGGFLLLCTDGLEDGFNRDITVRYNISQNDKDALFTLSGPISNVKIYNNTFYVEEGVTPAPRVVGSYNWATSDGNPQNVRFTNNIFYMNGDGQDFIVDPANIVFDTNVFYGDYDFSALPAVNTITEDPLFVDAGSGRIGLDTVEGYKLRGDSPCIDAGKSLSNAGGQDYFGAAVPQGSKPDIGAAECR